MPPTLEDDDHGGDTIVVKGENDWSRPSSPESLCPEILEPLVANLLAQINPRQRLESPEPYEDTPLEKEQQKPQPNRRISRRPKANVTTMEDRLQQMPEKRPLPWRPGVEEGADIETGGESRRKQIRFGCLLATRGEVQIPGCNSCVNGRGKFSLCVALDGYFKGACASCQLSGRPNRCSIKKEDDMIPSPAAGTPSAEASFNDGQQATPPTAPRSSGPPRKRRRTSEVKRANEAKHTSPNGAPASNPPPPPPPPHQPPQWGQQAPQAQQVSDLPPQKSWATVNQPAPKPTIPSNGNGHIARDHYVPSTSTGWATVNQPQHPMQPQIQPQIQPQYQPLPQPRVSPPVQRLLYNGGESNGTGIQRDSEQERRESTIEEGSVALIDSLPKNKQRQVYGLVSGLQGGIEHLQRELDSLKRALGIDDEN